MSPRKRSKHQREKSRVLGDALSALLNAESSVIVQSVRSQGKGGVPSYDALLSVGRKLLGLGGELQRSHYASCNAEVWPLSPDLTIKIFCFLDTTSLMRAMATCSAWAKVASEAACYGTIDLVGTKASEHAVAEVTERAGTQLRCLRLGSLPEPAALPVPRASSPWKPTYVDKTKGVLRLSPLRPACLDRLVQGSALERLHLYNMLRLKESSLHRVFAACPQLREVELVGLLVNVNCVLGSLGSHCPELRRLFFQPPRRLFPHCQGTLKATTAATLVSGCPLLTSLTIRGGSIPDKRVVTCIAGLPLLKELDMSRAHHLQGSFLCSIAAGEHGRNLESINLHDCERLKEVHVEKFLTALLAGELKGLRELDVSNKEGLAAGAWFERAEEVSPCIQRAVAKLRAERPHLKINADNPDLSSDDDSDDMRYLQGPNGGEDTSSGEEDRDGDEDSDGDEMSGSEGSSGGSSEDSEADEFDDDDEEEEDVAGDEADEDADVEEGEDDDEDADAEEGEDDDEDADVEEGEDDVDEDDELDEDFMGGPDMSSSEGETD